MDCVICGKPLNPKQQKYCSAKCRNKMNGIRQAEKRSALPKDKYKKVCGVCGKPFETNQFNQKYCCKKCSYVAKRSKEYRPAQLTETMNRPFTKDTAFLVRKWHDEGMTIKAIAEMLQRTEENVMGAFEE